MATPAPSAKPTVVTVEKGDSLWSIADAYLGSGSKYTQLATLNGIKPTKTSSGDMYYISVGQKIKLSGTATTTTTTKSSTKNPYKVTIKQFGLLASSDSPTLYAVWLYENEEQRYHTDHYEVEWEYTIEDTGGSIWWTGEKTTTKDSEHKFDIPTKAERVRFRVKPVAQTREITKTVEKSSGNKLLDWMSGGSQTQTQTVQEPYYTGEWTDFEKDGVYTIYNVSSVPPTAPPVPTVEIDETDKTKLNVYIQWDTAADLEALDATHIAFQIIKDNDTLFESSGKVLINEAYQRVSYTNSKPLPDGGEYKVRARAHRKSSLHSEWSGYSETVITKPAKPAGFTSCVAKSSSLDGKISVYLKWDAVNTATVYDVEYTTSIEYFDTDQTQTFSSIKDNFLETYSLDKGYTYYFRLRAVNSGGESDWSEISKITLGEAPAQPTTWSSTTTAAVDSPLTLYWIHNAKDGSSQTMAQLRLEIYIANGVDDQGNVKYELKWTKEEDIPNSTDPDEKDKTSRFDVVKFLKDNIPLYYKDGVQLRWQVRTAGVTKEFNTKPGENYGWSVVRMVDIYAQPSVTMSIKDGTNGSLIDSGVLRSFPIHISTTTTPSTQAPIGFHLTIVSNDIYQTIDDVGNNKVVNTGDQVYSKYFDQGTDLNNVIISAGDVDFESSKNYTITCVAAMNSGLTAEDSLPFTVSWEDISYVPNAAISYDPTRYITQIRPYCSTGYSTYYGVTYDSTTDTYISTNTEVAVVEGSELRRNYTKDDKQVFIEYGSDGTPRYYYIDYSGRQITISRDSIAKTVNVYTTDGRQVYEGSTELTIDTNGNITGGDTVYYYSIATAVPVEGVTLAVYRREFDGSFTELAKNIDHTKNTYIVDPHPSLDYARYRIVATTQSTGAVSYYDVPGFQIQEKAIIIQWDEEWSEFDAYSDDPPAKPEWAGSLLKLPYNIDISDSYNMDVSHVNYVGRKRSVSYYGTHLGETSNWSTEIPKADKATLYALRRLAIWTGDVYVREPSGSGYWATVRVSFGQTHGSLTIPVTLSITRVEGGA